MIRLLISKCRQSAQQLWRERAVKNDDGGEGEGVGGEGEGKGGGK